MKLNDEKKRDATNVTSLQIYLTNYGLIQIIINRGNNTDCFYVRSVVVAVGN